nr:hypothetical protein 36 [bacterium]
MSQIPFPGGAADQDVFFHEDKVCVYHKAINTWECRTVNAGGAEAGQPAAVTTQTVYTVPIPGQDGRVANSNLSIPELNTQYDVNWFLAEKLEQAQLAISYLEMQLGSVDKIFVGEGTPYNAYNQYAFWYKPSTGQFHWWNQDQGQWVLITGGRNPIFSDQEPTVHPDFTAPDNELQSGDIWIDTTDPDHLIEYIYDGSQWIRATGNFVKRVGGDSMEGPLELEGSKPHLNLKNGSQIQSSGKEIITMGGSGGFYRGVMSHPEHLVNKSYVDEADDRLQLQVNLNTQSIINNSQEIDTITDDVVKENNEGLKVIRHGETSFYAPEPIDLILTYRKLTFNQNISPKGDNQLHFIKFAGMIVDRKTGENYVGQERNLLDKYGNNNEYAPIAAPQILGNSVIFATGHHTDGYSFQVARASSMDPNDPDYKPYVIEAYNDGKISKHKGRIRWSVKLDDKRILYMGHALDGSRPGKPPADMGNPLADDGPNVEQIVCLLDTDDLINDVPYETFDRLDVNGDPHNGLKAYTKLIADDIGGAPAVLNRGRAGAQQVYILQAGRNIKRVVTGDLDNKEVTLEDETNVPLSFEYITDNNNNRKAYKGKVNGLTAYEDRFLIWHSFAEGIMCYDTIQKALTNLHPTPEHIVYGNNELDSISPSVPQLFGSLYFVAESSRDWGGNRVDPKMIIVNSDLTTDTIDIPRSAYDGAGDWHCTNTDRTSNNEIFCTNLGYYAYKYNAVDGRWVEYYSGGEYGFGGVFRVNGVNTITPAAYYDGPGHSWNYKDSFYNELVNGLNPNIIENTDWSFLEDDQDFEEQLYRQLYESVDYTLYDNVNTDYPLTAVIKPKGWTGNGAPSQFWYDDEYKPYHVGFKGGNQAHNTSFPAGNRVKIEHTSGVMYATVESSWWSNQVHMNLEKWVGDPIIEGEEITAISYGEFLPHLLRTAGGTMTGELLMLGDDADIQLKGADIWSYPVAEDDDGDNPGRWTNIMSRRVRKSNGDLVQGAASDFGIRVDLTEGRTGYNKFQFFSNVDGSGPEKFADFGGGNNPTFRFHRGSFQMEGNRIRSLGKALDDTDAVNLSQLNDLRDQIIAQTLQGEWKLDQISSLVTPNEGSMVMLINTSNAASTFSQVQTIKLNVKDNNNTSANYDGWDEGEVMTVRSKSDPDLEVTYRLRADTTISGPGDNVVNLYVTYVSQTKDYDLFGTFGEVFEFTLSELKIPAGRGIPYQIDEEGDTHWYDHRLEDVGHPQAATDAATKGYVDAHIGGRARYKYTFTNSLSFEELTPGKFALYDADFNNVSKQSEAKAIAFICTDAEGKSVLPANSSGIIMNLGCVLRGFNSARDREMFRIAGVAPQVEYNAGENLMIIYWAGDYVMASPGGFTQWTNGGSVYLECPDLFIN